MQFYGIDYCIISSEIKLKKVSFASLLYSVTETVTLLRKIGTDHLIYQNLFFYLLT